MLSRRSFIIASSTIGAAAVLGTGAWLAIPRNEADLTIANLLSKLQKTDINSLQPNGEMNLFQCLTHMAQSVEYSMTGYPQHKSDLFKSTVGKAAFTAFSSKGQMSHNLSEPIPGAPAISAEGDPLLALERLTSSLQNFEGYQGELFEHFAYGSLSKDDYALAHVMHVYDHLGYLS